MPKFKPAPEMIGAHRSKTPPGGFVNRRQIHRKEVSMESVKRVATRWLNVKGPEIQNGFFAQ